MIRQTGETFVAAAAVRHISTLDPKAKLPEDPAADVGPPLA